MITDLLKELDYTPSPRVAGLIYQHHEKFNGSGYPQHLESFRIDEHAALIAIADLLDSICRGQYDGQKYTLPEALVLVAKIEKSSTFPEYFNPNTFKNVMNWLKKGGGVDYLAAAENAVNEAKQAMLKTS
ncbi:MAG: hypothetical protein HY075_09620 [Deltaproteobacteria bacterium]|nr:hypothetical protein [Deltaproteobacteria bacterium]